MNTDPFHVGQQVTFPGIGTYTVVKIAAPKRDPRRVLVHFQAVDGPSKFYLPVEDAQRIGKVA